MATPAIIVPDNYLVLRDGKFDLKNGGGPAALQAFFEKIKEDKPQRIVLHFHGGLVKREDGEASAAIMSPLYESSETTGGDAAPLFIIWETGWMEIISQNIPAIIKEAIFDILVKKVTAFVGGKLNQLTGAESKGIDPLDLEKDEQIQQELDNGSQGAPMFPSIPVDAIPEDFTLEDDELAQIEKNLKHDPNVNSEMQSIANARQTPSPEQASKSITATGSTETLMSPDVLDDIAPLQTEAEGESKGLFSAASLAIHVGKVVVKVIARLVKHRDHGLYLTIIEEVMREFYVRNAGKFLWDGMKKEVADAFGPDPDCGGTQLVGSFVDLWVTAQPRVSLVAHSAGAIYVARLLKELHAKMPADFRTDITFVAPACTYDVIADSLKAAGERVNEMRIFGMSDPVERSDHIIPVVYPASLLYFVSGVLEDESDQPLLGMQRFLGPPYVGTSFANIDYVRSFAYLSAPDGFAWSPLADGDGKNCDMKSHGGWIKDAGTTRASVLWIVRNGY